jgi:hypothetical protein
MILLERPSLSNHQVRNGHPEVLDRLRFSEFTNGFLQTMQATIPIRS